ncbi:hypothetical protein CCYA_CCYA03G0954 [Cyanidiococcus yangmingshanensis]|nr:hypothetical protein CCYA_CCYA03G0954 [Cyanidiococcus yangmingshanensis]
MADKDASTEEVSDASSSTLRRIIRRTRLFVTEWREKPFVQATVLHPERTLSSLDDAFSQSIARLVRKTRESLSSASPLLPVTALGLGLWGSARVYRRLRELVRPRVRPTASPVGLGEIKPHQ